MRIEATLVIAIALSGAMAQVHAFEPGHDRVCTPSADGQSFECRDKSTGAIIESKAKPAEPVTTAPKPLAAPAATATPVTAVSTPASEPTARNLPSYLMQNPSAAQPASDIKPATAERPASTRQPVRDGQPAVADISPAKVQAPPTRPAAASHALGVDEISAAKAQQPAAEPAPAPHSSATSLAPVRDESRVMPDPEPLAQSPSASPSDSKSLPGASAFLALPASHYTLVLASERNPSAFDDLIRSLGAHTNQLYLLKLGMPDGDWYSLCWSEFTDLEAARAARASLPADAPIRSGWPRRIGLLQKEIAR